MRSFAASLRIGTPVVHSAVARPSGSAGALLDPHPGLVRDRGVVPPLRLPRVILVRDFVVALIRGVVIPGGCAAGSRVSPVVTVDIAIAVPVTVAVAGAGELAELIREVPGGLF